MTLQDVDPSLFGAVVHWCYQEKIDEMQQDENSNIVAIKEGRLMVLAKMWMLGQVRSLHSTPVAYSSISVNNVLFHECD
jgi:hypothetical protein